MAVSTEKTILFARAVDGKVTHQWPVATFNTPAQAKSYAGLIRLGHKSGSKDMILALDPSHKLDADGAPLTDVKFAMTTVPYNPTPDIGADDDTEVSGS